MGKKGSNGSRVQVCSIKVTARYVEMGSKYVRWVRVGAEELGNEHYVGQEERMVSEETIQTTSIQLDYISDGLSLLAPFLSLYSTPSVPSQLYELLVRKLLSMPIGST